MALVEPIPNAISPELAIPNILPQDLPSLIKFRTSLLSSLFCGNFEKQLQSMALPYKSYVERFS